MTSRSHTVTTSELKGLQCFRKSEFKKWRNRSKIEKDLPSWQSICDSSQITTDIKQKLTNQEEFLCDGIILFLPFSFKQKKTMPRSYQKLVNNFSMALEKYFWFHWNYEPRRVEARNSRLIIVRLISWFSLEPDIWKYWKHFLSIFMDSVGLDYCKKYDVKSFVQNLSTRLLHLL